MIITEERPSYGAQPEENTKYSPVGRMNHPKSQIL